MNEYLCVCVCRDCGKDAHEICTCEMWKTWLLRIDQMQVKIGTKE